MRRRHTKLRSKHQGQGCGLPRGGGAVLGRGVASGGGGAAPGKGRGLPRRTGQHGSLPFAPRPQERTGDHDGRSVDSRSLPCPSVNAPLTLRWRAALRASLLLGRAAGAGSGVSA